MAVQVAKLNQVCQEVLAAILDAYTDAGVAADLPGRRYVSAGPPAFDCEQVTVHVNRVLGHEGNVNQEAPNALTRHAGHTMRAAELVVTVVRCAPTGKRQGQNMLAPSEDQEEAAAVLVHADVGLVLNALIAAERAGDLPTCSGVVFLQWSSVSAQGGFVGGQQLLRVNLSAGVL